MASVTKQLVVAINVICLLIALALGIYALRTIDAYALPIPTALGAISIVLPVLTGVSVETVRATSRRRQKKQPKRTPTYLSTFIPIFILSIFETVLATLAGTHVGPVEDLTCGLEKRWQKLFQAKDAKRIQTIQDAFQCCGLHSVHDRAWPFQDKSHGIDTCHDTYGRNNSCFEAWRKSEQQTAAIVLLIPILVFLWQIFVLTAPIEQYSWMGRVLPRRLWSNRSGFHTQRVSEVPQIEPPYTDDPENPDEAITTRARRFVEGARAAAEQDTNPAVPTEQFPGQVTTENVEQNAWRS